MHKVTNICFTSIYFCPENARHRCNTQQKYENNLTNYQTIPFLCLRQLTLIVLSKLF